MAATAGPPPHPPRPRRLARAVPLALAALAVPLALLLAAFAGCSTKPRAPALTTEAVYSNDAIGLTFTAPEGWVVTARTTPPPGKPLDRPLRLVVYHQSAGEARGDLELYALEPPDDQDLMAYLAAHPLGPDKWVEKAPPRSETIGGAAATRYAQVAAKAGPHREAREIVAFRRGGRVYLLVLTYDSTDETAQQQGRRAIESATWK